MKMIMLKAGHRDNLWNLKRLISEPPEVTALTARPTHHDALRRARKNLDHHPNYILAAYVASGT
jgi:hypothetical protein